MSQFGGVRIPWICGRIGSIVRKPHEHEHNSVPVEFQTLLFYGFSAVLIAAALGVVTVRNPIYAALMLVVAFIFAAGLWMLMEAEFLAIALVLVYVGAVMVLFLFVIMMLDLNLEVLREGFWRYLPLGASVGASLLFLLVAVLGPLGEETFPVPAPEPHDYSNTRELGMMVYTHYVYPFQLAAVVLLVAIIAAIAITLRRRPGNRNVDPAWQVRASARDRLRVLKMQPVGSPVLAAASADGEEADHTSESKEEKRDGS